MESLELIALLKDHQQEFSTVIPFNSSTDKLLPFDFSPANKEITEDIFDSTPAFTSFINHKLKEANARYGIGGYNKKIQSYSRRKKFFVNGIFDEKSRKHLCYTL